MIRDKDVQAYRDVAAEVLKEHSGTSGIANMAIKAGLEAVTKPIMDLLNEAIEFIPDVVPRRFTGQFDKFWRDYFKMTGQHVILTDEGWEPGESKQSYIDSLEPDESIDSVILDELNAPDTATSDKYIPSAADEIKTDRRDKMAEVGERIVVLMSAALAIRGLAGGLVTADEYVKAILDIFENQKSRLTTFENAFTHIKDALSSRYADSDADSVARIVIERIEALRRIVGTIATYNGVHDVEPAGTGFIEDSLIAETQRLRTAVNQPHAHQFVYPLSMTRIADVMIQVMGCACGATQTLTGTIQWKEEPDVSANGADLHDGREGEPA